MSDTISHRADEVIGEFSMLDDWMDRYAHLIELGRTLPPMHDTLKTDDNRVRGCQSQVWLHAERAGDRIYYLADSDALITRGLVALLVRVLDGQPANEVANADLGFLQTIGLQEHLSPTRANGLAAMVARMKAAAESV